MDVLNRLGNSNLKRLPGGLYLDIRRVLDSKYCWEPFVNVLDGRYILPDELLRRLNDDRHPGDSLLLKLSSLDMTIQEFVNYALIAQIYPILRLFNVRVPAQITRQPHPIWYTTAGESVSFELQTIGSPQPIFQWLKNNVPIPNETRSMLKISSLCEADSGTYKCAVQNGPPQEPAIVSNPIQLTVSAAKPLMVTEQPLPCTVSPPGNALFRFKMEDDLNVDYQWMRNGKEVTDSGIVSGSNTTELKIYNIENEDWTGCYYCRISRGEEFIFTDEVVLRLSTALAPTLQYKAADKVALLMGAGDYRSERPLTAPRYDVQTMASIFRSLNFKVVALMDLTKQEMIAAIHEFKHLVGEDVYCVFYFCGHGFEAGGQCFLLPPDAPLGNHHSHCLSTDAILFNILLPQKPKICCMILDICRLRYDGPYIPDYNKPPDAEYVFCYATAQGLVSYEHRTTGVLVSNLKNILLSRIGVEQVFTILRTDIHKDPVFHTRGANGDSRKQFPEMRTILSEPLRSFHDEIDSTGYTEAFSRRQMLWERAHRQPDSRQLTVQFPGFVVRLRLDFQPVFSNELGILLSVTDNGRAKMCNAHISEIPADVARKAKSYSLSEGKESSLCKNCLVLHDIQRLKEPLVITVTVTCLLHDNTEVKGSVEENLGRPLVSYLELWREYPSLSRSLEAEEAEDGENEEVEEYV